MLTPKQVGFEKFQAKTKLKIWIKLKVYKGENKVRGGKCIN
jgi:hypothetical protein